MDKLIKLFPLMPEEKDSGKLALAIIFYLIVPSLVGSIIGAILGLTIILLPLAGIVGMVVMAYTIAGIVFAIMSYSGKELPGTAPKE